MLDLTIFKAYDIRGIYPGQVNAEVAFIIGVAYAKYLNAKKVVVGRDVRESGPELLDALVAGLQSQGVEVVSIGMITTEMIYFAASFYDFDGGIAVTASHNPREYNGFKLCRNDASPIGAGVGMEELSEIAQGIEAPESFAASPIKSIDILDDYFKFLKDHFVTGKIGSFKIAANSNFGMQATYLKKLIAYLQLPLEVTYLNDEPDGTFPKGRPDPMIPSNRAETVALIQETGADFGAAWDSDADRCFFYDHTGKFIDPYYVNTMLIDFLLSQEPKKKVFHDMRLFWAIEDVARKHKAEDRVVIAKAGNAFVKSRMRQDDLDFGAEISAHYFFKDFSFADNGLIPFLWMLQILTEQDTSLHALVEATEARYPKVDEMLFTVPSVVEVVAALKTEYRNGDKFDDRDGVSYEFESWRFNARGSNTEPLLKVNLEAKTQEEVDLQAQKLGDFIAGLGGVRVVS